MHIILVGLPNKCTKNYEFILIDYKQMTTSIVVSCENRETNAWNEICLKKNCR